MLSAFTQANPQNLLSRETFANGRIIERYNGVTIVQDPSINIEDDETRLALLAELTAQAAPPTADLDLDAVNERLLNAGQSKSPGRSRSPSEARTITPPPYDAAEELQIALDEEIRQRAELLAEGCPPCHPPEFTFPYDTEERIPRQHPAAIYYLEGQRGYMTKPIGVQRGEWYSFRSLQKTTREDCASSSNPQDAWSRYIRHSQWFLRDRGYEESASLIDWTRNFKRLPYDPYCIIRDVPDQSAFQNWLEFQAWHCRRIRKQRARIPRLVRGEGDRFKEWRQNFEDRRLELYEGMLVWIEEQRVAMVKKEAEDKMGGVQTSSSAQQGQRSSHASSDAAGDDKAIVSVLAEQRRRSLRARRTKEVQQVVAAPGERPAAALSRTRGKTRVGKPSASKTLGVRQANLAAKQARTSGSKTSRPQQKQQGQQRQQAAGTPAVYTRSGRQIKKPVRLGY